MPKYERSLDSAEPALAKASRAIAIAKSIGLRITMSRNWTPAPNKGGGSRKKGAMSFLAPSQT